MTRQKIKILDACEAIKIAAGEVIERPAHIIKELIENSIDAGAKNITLHLQNAGKNFIKITDDGFGMSPDDAILCFAHHATSKISTVHDLHSIATYGFRGEALSSIACISNVVLITKTDHEKIATELKLEQGKIVSNLQTSHPTGTTFIISHLFDNIPARKKFLKSDDTEWNFIVTIIQAFCLRYPQIHFKIFHNEMMAYNCPATEKLTTRCAQLWSNNLHDQLLELTPSSDQKMTISGAISNQSYHRFNRGQIFTFVNNRWVKNSELFKGILKGYDGVLPAQKFPAAFIFIEIDPDQVDINIHPKKEEVKFLHPAIVQRFVELSVKNCLQSQIKETLENKRKENMDPRLREDEGIVHFNAINFSKSWNNKNNTEPTSFQNFTSPIDSNINKPLNFKPIPTFATHISEFDSFPFQTTEPFLNSEHANTDLNAKLDETAVSVETAKPSNNFSTKTYQINSTLHEEHPCGIIGQFKKTYIMVEKSEQLIMIDQHAAHERILYERFQNNKNNVATVQLLFPHIVKFTEQEITVLEQYQPLLHKHGIIFDRFSDHEIIIQATPVETSGHSAQEILQTALIWIDQNKNITNDEMIIQLHEKVLAEKACKAACKAGDRLNIEQMQNLIKELIITEKNFCCPHGRPTMWTLQLKEIEKHFKRDYAGAKTIW
ncbi:DNA mismatch repair endonuclease MutL [Candidatus Babeliales bacterium]|nr:DNA mismatch repair endonuclease MutL [Candidatus Babeliales bacterium]